MKDFARRARASVTLRLAVLALIASGCSRGSVERPNLMLISLGGVAAEATSCAQPRPLPTLCALAERGARFRWAFATSVQVAPSVASILSSLAPRDHGLEASPSSLIPSNRLLLAEVLRGAGYRTAGFPGRARLGRSSNLHQGFDSYGSERGAADTTAAAVAWLRQALEQKQAWFLWVHLDVDAEAAAENSNQGLATIEAGLEALVAAANDQVAIAVVGSHGRAEFDFESERTDGDRATSRPPPLIALRGARVPLVWRPPGGMPGRTLSRPVSTLDLAPTLLRAAAIEPPPSFRGERLRTGEHHPAAPRSRAILIEGSDRTSVAAIVLAGRYYGRDRRAGLAWTARLDAGTDLVTSPIVPGAPPTGPLDRRLAEAMGWAGAAAATE